MSENKSKSTPEEFSSIHEAAAYWDTHSLAEAWDETKEIDVQIKMAQHKRVTLAADLIAPLIERSQQEGVSIETLVNLWIAERLHSAQ
jgi:hypothetical protein